MIEDIDKTALANAWIKRSLIASGDSQNEDKTDPNRTDAYFWAFKELERLVREDPFSALEVIIQIVEIKPEESVLDHLSAGPLETLLVRHGDKVIAPIEREASKNADFRWLVGGVWENKIAPDIWERLQKVIES